MDGTWALTTLNVLGGIVISNNWVATPIVTVNLTGGLLDFGDSPFNRTVTTMNHDLGDYINSKEVVTFTTLNQPAGLKRVSIKAVA